MHDPYRPPATTLESPAAAPRKRGVPPPSIRNAGRILWVSVATIVAFMVAWGTGLVRGPGGASMPAVAVLGNVVTIAFLLFVADSALKARNWVRWVFAVLWGMGFVSLAFSLAFALEAWQGIPLSFRLMNLVQTALQLWAIILMFTPQSAAWFASKGFQE